MKLLNWIECLSPSPATAILPRLNLSNETLSSQSVSPAITQVPNTHFYLSNTKKRWHECKNYANGHNFEFASIGNQDENDVVVRYLHNNGTEFGIWLGGYQTSFDNERTSNWVWLDGRPWTDSTYSNWAVEELKEDRNNKKNYLYLWSRDGTWWNEEPDTEYSCLYRDFLL